MYSFRDYSLRILGHPPEITGYNLRVLQNPVWERHRHGWRPSGACTTLAWLGPGARGWASLPLPTRHFCTSKGLLGVHAPGRHLLGATDTQLVGKLLGAWQMKLVLFPQG